VQNSRLVLDAKLPSAGHAEHRATLPDLQDKLRLSNESLSSELMVSLA